uniref:FUN14 domain containing 1 n=2 Tax=Apteryx TaxID=8821 RepID=A0A8B9QEV7_APTOW
MRKQGNQAPRHRPPVRAVPRDAPPPAGSMPKWPPSPAPPPRPPPPQNYNAHNPPGRWEGNSRYPMTSPTPHPPRCRLGESPQPLLALPAGEGEGWRAHAPCHFAAAEGAAPRLGESIERSCRWLRRAAVWGRSGAAPGPAPLSTPANMAARRPRIASEHESDDDSYEVLDLTEYARRHHWWNRVFGRNSGPIVEKYSVATQIVMGGVTGWCAGFLFQKVGKLAATAVGGGFLLLQIASHSGYVQVDWKRVEKDVNKAKKQLKKRANKAAPEINTLIEESTEFIKQNIVVSSGFVGGFLLGLAS